MSLLLSRRALYLAIAFACAGMMAFALYMQYYRWLNPCPLCMFQRAALISLGSFALLAAIHNPAGKLGRRVYGVLTSLSALTALGISLRHSYIQTQPAGDVASCGAGLYTMLDEMPLGKVIWQVLSASGECAKIDWTFLGLSMPNWGVLYSAGYLLLCLYLGFKAKK